MDYKILIELATFVIIVVIFIIRIEGKVNSVDDNVNSVDNKLNSEINKLNKDLDALEKRTNTSFANIGVRFDSFKKTTEDMNSSLSRIEGFLERKGRK